MNTCKMEEEGIKKLERREKCDYRNEPLLEYVNDTADLLWSACDGFTEDGEPDYSASDVPHMFALYFVNGEIDTSMEKDYLEHEKVQNTLQAFGLDKDKFWYLCLMIKDVVRGYTEDTHPVPSTPREDFQRLLDGIMKMKGQGFLYENNIELTLKVKDREKKYDKKITITNGQTVYWLGSIIKGYLEDHPETNHLDQIWHTPIPKTSPIHEKEIWKVVLFHKYMNEFLEWHLANKNVKKELEREITMSSGKRRKTTILVDINRQQLISRMIYILGISKDERYNNSKSKILKNNLKREYKDPEPKNQNNRYYILFRRYDIPWMDDSDDEEEGVRGDYIWASGSEEPSSNP